MSQAPYCRLPPSTNLFIIPFPLSSLPQPHPFAHLPSPYSQWSSFPHTHPLPI